MEPELTQGGRAKPHVSARQHVGSVSRLVEVVNTLSFFKEGR